ncbi:MAG: hypothetical protein ACXAEU_04385 [Candidatus Hodarchaeales archaeon]|jgi:hypothetical protein
MTAQIPDEYRYKGENYSLVGVKGTDLFTPADFGMTPYYNCTACWRGYVMQYDCIGDKLVLNGMRINVDDPPKINGIEPKSGDELFKYCYENLNHKTTFTGTILLAKDFIQEMYVHMGFQRPIAYRKVIELLVENGNITMEIDLSTKMKEYREKDPYKNAYPPSDSNEDIKEWIEQTFSLDYDED